MKTLALVLLSLGALTLSAPAQFNLKAGDAAPAFSGSSLDGASTYDLAALRGSVVLVTFWSTRCGICHSELPKLSKNVRNYDGKKIVFLAMSMENEAKLNAYLAKNPLKFTVMPNRFDTLLKYADRDKAGNLNMGFPAFYVIDQEGVIRHRASGYNKLSGVETAIGKLISK